MTSYVTTVDSVSRESYQQIKFNDNKRCHLLAGLGLRGSLSALPPSGHIRPTVPQQVFLLIRSVAASELKFSDSWSYCL